MSDAAFDEVGRKVQFMKEMESQSRKLVESVAKTWCSDSTAQVRILSKSFLVPGRVLGTGTWHTDKQQVHLRLTKESSL